MSSELGKEIALTTEGAETELDKTVIEKLNDPLVHLIRNCIDHGIELPEDRRKLDKPRSGVINLAAYHEGANVVIKISDDGAGLDIDAIRAKAVSRGLINSETVLAEQEIYSLIFNPGFSTAENVTKVSGRGVGMDVVKRAIETLGGQIEIESEHGKGSTIILQLPLTLAIIEGLLVSVANSFFVFPLSAVEVCEELTREESEKSKDSRIKNFRGEVLPYIRLREIFGIDGVPPEIEQIAVIKIQNKRVGIVVDVVIGDHQTVIKPLSSVYQSVDTVSGATILGDGTVALILDVFKLAKNAEAVTKTT